MVCRLLSLHRRYSHQRKKKAELKRRGGLVEDLQDVVKGMKMLGMYVHDCISDMCNGVVFL